MEQMNLLEKPNLYNSSIEIGIRTLILLNELHPAALDVECQHVVHPPSNR